MLPALLEFHASARPDNRAIVSAGETLTWRNLLQAVTLHSARLASLGVGPGDRVALLLPNSPALVIYLLAIAQCGSVAVPIDEDNKADEIAPKLKSSACRLLVSVERHLDSARHWIASGPLDRALFVNALGAETLLLGAVPPVVTENPPPLPLNQQAEFLELFTSGTTGTPKRIVRSHQNLLALAAAYCEAVQITADDRILTVIPLTHGHGICTGLLAMLHSGATLYLQPTFNRRITVELLQNEAITLFSAVPFIFSILARSNLPEPFHAPNVRYAITGGAPLSNEIWTLVRDKLGIELRQSYGSSETGLICLNIGEDPQSTVASVGQPLSCVEIAILDKTGTPKGPGLIGEIAVKSPASGDAIYNTKTNGSASKSPLSCPDGWVRTGDIGHIDEQGYLYIKGRIGRMINVAGRKVDPNEIEAVLLSHSAVLAAIATPEEDSFGETYVAAKITISEPVTSTDLAQLCRGQLAAYKVPRSFIIKRPLLP